MFFSDDQLKEVIAEFKDEAIDLLNGMETALLEIQEHGVSKDRINAVFRAAHTIKGSGGMLKLDKLVEFTHIAENLLDDIRNDKIAFTDDMITTFLKCKDHMQNLVLFYATHAGQDLDEKLKTISAFLMDELRQFSGVHTPLSSSKGKKESDSSATQPKVSGWDIRVTFGKELLLVGMDPSNFIRFLASLGEVVSVHTELENIKPLSTIDPTKCYIASHVKLLTDVSQKEIEDVFEFIKDDIVLSIKPYGGDEDTSEEEIDDEGETESVNSPSTLPNGNLTPVIPSEEQSISIISNTLRVDSDKIDALINLIGEMVIANANVIQKSSELNNDDLIESVSIVSHMLEEIREGAMKIRMVQIGETFNRFKRIVHDVSKKLGKDVELVISGGETEMDKTIVEKISDPLVHIVRNAMDHGLESTNDRIAIGKKPKGRIELNAFHDAGMIVIEIVDDGRGLNEEKIFAKAVEKGLIDPNAKLSQKEIFSLILEPGFSTADQITDLSGRGVGMDVVKRNIQALRGTIDIKSAKGVGTTFTIRLPLTLAIIDGFLVRVGRTHYVIPLDMVLECVELPENNDEKMSGNDYINLRGTILPVLSLRNFFDEKAQKISNDKENVVVVQSGEVKFGLIVEELLGEFQTVIKPLGKIYRGVKGIGGSTILGSGEVALIVDVPMLNNTIGAMSHYAEKG
ncbi:chemotaxis protein CheA [Sulfuricurvum sp.]|uniref:chemotaxis protein CheA n=1 Tax=Sulfuricurvum sp. TaxID=2025608 RepID=UPI0025E1F1CF|nr:chemotaxis protein CheA [Sulfuricurvum sp.]